MSDAAKVLQALRRNKRGGRPVKPSWCPRCGAQCASRKLATAHCRKPRKTAYPAPVKPTGLRPR